ncbi:MAG: IS5 family transposase [Roseivirga sp.]
MLKQPAYQRHDISDEVWNKLAPHLPGRAGAWGGVAKDNRKFINAVFWILRTGAPWRDLPPHYGEWNNTNRRFCRWRDNGTWEKLLELLSDEPDYTWLMIDASHIKVHPHGTGAVGGNEAMNRTKGGFNTKLHLAVDASGMPLRAIITAGTEADCKQGVELLKDLPAGGVIADRGYDTEQVVKEVKSKNRQCVIPSRKHRKVARSYNREVYQLRHVIENTFLYLKRWRGICTRYAKRGSSFLAAIQIRCLALWLDIS